MLAPIATNAWPVASIASRVTFMLLEKMSAPGLDVAEDGSPGVEAEGEVRCDPQARADVQR
jgi:hypothetical protein